MVACIEMQVAEDHFSGTRIDCPESAGSGSAGIGAGSEHGHVFEHACSQHAAFAQLAHGAESATITEIIDRIIPPLAFRSSSDEAPDIGCPYHEVCKQAQAGEPFWARMQLDECSLGRCIMQLPVEAPASWSQR